MSYRKLELSYSSSHHISELDGVRGIAVLLVVLFHCFPGPLTGIGWIGVDLFFVLSGFLITGILIDSKGNNKYYVNFIGRRILRIFPLYYLVLFIILFLIPTFGGVRSGSNFDFYTQHQGWFWSYLQNWLYSFHGFPENLILVHFWSLGVEEQFYLVWPWVVLFIPERYLLKISLLLCVAAITFRLLPLTWFNFAPQYRYMNTFSRMDALLLGGIIAQLIRKNKKVLEKIIIPVGILGLSVFIIGLIIKRSLSFSELPFYYTAIDLFMCMILVMSVSNVKWIRNILRYTPLTFLGKYSYGLYVYHYIIYILLKYKLGNWLSLHLSYFSPVILMLILGIITVVSSLIVCVLSYHLFEVHFLKLKVYFRNGPKKSESTHKEVQPMNLSVETMRSK